MPVAPLDRKPRPLQQPSALPLLSPPPATRVDEPLGTGVHMVTVYPGPVDTDMGRTGKEKYETTRMLRLTPFGTSEALAKLVILAVERRRPRVIYPRIYALAMSFPRLTCWFTERFTPPLKRLGAGEGGSA